MVKDYMLTVLGGMGARDVQVNNAESMRSAIALAEHETGCRVDHGRAGIGSRFRPAIIIDATTGEAVFMHDEPAIESMQVANAFKGKVFVDKGEGR